MKLLPLLFALVVAQPALSAPYKNDNVVVIDKLTPKVKYTVEYGNLRKMKGIKLVPDRCGTIILKSKFFAHSYSRFAKAKDYIFEGDNGTSKTITVTQQELKDKQDLTDWTTVESYKVRYSCVNNVIPAILDKHWIERNGIKIARLGDRLGNNQKIIITGLPYSTVHVKSTEDSKAIKKTQIVSTDKCGNLVIKDKPEFPLSGLGKFRIAVKGGYFDTYDVDDMFVSNSLVSCGRYTR